MASSTAESAGTARSARYSEKNHRASYPGRLQPDFTQRLDANDPTTTPHPAERSAPVSRANREDAEKILERTSRRNRDLGHSALQSRTDGKHSEEHACERVRNHPYRLCRLPAALLD